jgi:5-methylcytosine-specific restriction endonuclease McrA
MKPKSQKPSAGPAVRCQYSKLVAPGKLVWVSSDYERAYARAYMARRRAEHPELVKASNAKSRLKLRDVIKERGRERYRAQHSRFLNEAQERRQKLGPERLKELRAAYYQRHKEEIKSKSEAYRNKVGTAVTRAWARQYRATPKGRAILVQQRSQRRLLEKQKSPETLAKIESIRSGMASCYWCGKEIDGRLGSECHIDHVVALAAGGKHEASNIVPACPTCNLQKSDLPANEFQKRKGMLGLRFEMTRQLAYAIHA